MINTVEFLPRPTIDAINIDDYLLIAEELKQQKEYKDEYTVAYERLRDMYAYNYDTIIDSDYDELHKIHYYEWLHEFSDSVS
jgi:hypothetical protein|tara:strand:+ start:926 stop:1171 length:246 start_codon:yes stop_codon:yes gene_type:complete